MKDCNSYFLQLNNIAKENFSSIGNIAFYYGDYTEKLKEVLSKIIPFGKALFLCTHDEFDTGLISVMEKVKKSSVKVIMISDDEILDYRDLKETLPEDIRAVVSFNSKFYELSSRLATELNLFCVCVVKEFNFSNLIGYSTNVVINGEKESFIFDADTHVIFDIEKILLDQANAFNEYAFIMSKLIALIDYRVYGLVTENPTNRKAYSLVKSAVEETFSIFSYSREEYLHLIIKNSIMIRLANIISKGKILSNSSVDIAVKLVGKQSSIIPLSKRIIKLYTLCFSSQFDGTATPNYLERVEKILPLDTASERQVGRWLITQSQIYDKKSQVVGLIKESLKAEVFEYNKVFNKVEKTYLALGGILGDYNDEIISICGDFYSTFNGMSLVRESGITEVL